MDSNQLTLKSTENTHPMEVDGVDGAAATGNALGEEEQQKTELDGQPEQKEPEKNAKEPESKDADVGANGNDKPAGEDASSEYPPTSVVLAKVKGYPPWPAMVLEQSLLPDHITSKKPKSIKVAKTKSKKPVGIVPVRFFSDDTYIWIKTNEIKPLTPSMIEEFLNKPNKRKDNLLESAYTLAKNPLDMELFIKYGSSGKPPPDPEPIELDLEEIKSENSDVNSVGDSDGEEEPARKKNKSGPKSRAKPKSAKADSKKGKPGPKAKANSKSGPKPKPKPKPKEEPFEDPDWGVEEDLEQLYKQGNYIFDKKPEQLEFQATFPPGEVIGAELHQKSQQFQRVSDQLVPRLLQGRVDEKETEQMIRDLQGLEMPRALVLKSKLFKAMIVTNRKPINAKVRQLINEVLRQWADITIEENPVQSETNSTAQTPNHTPDPLEMPANGVH